MSWMGTPDFPGPKCVRLFTLLLLGFAGLLFFSNEAVATHAAGAELTYRHLGGMDYQVEAVFYRDCGGTPEPGNLTITYRSATCSISRTAIASKVAGINGIEITIPCATSPTTCNGGFSTGLKKWVYRAVITLPFACSDWIFSYRVCCRNCTLTTIQAPCSINSELYVEAQLNNLTVPRNNSAQFNSNPITYMCLGQNFNYNPSVTDDDGDSLYFELITPRTGPNTEIVWVSPSTTQQPLSSSTPFIMNSGNGDINFTPSALQVGIITVKIKEYRSGIFVGSVVRDMQVYTQNCNNTLPYTGGINGTSSFSIQACAGSQVCLQIPTMDTDSLQTVTFAFQNLPQGAVVTSSSGSRPVATICWTPTMADVSQSPRLITMTVRDNACPQNGMQTFSYAIYVSGLSPVVTVTQPLCRNQNNGSAVITGLPSSGTSILWNTQPVHNTPGIYGLAPGTYTALITDSVGCSASVSATVLAPDDSLTVTATATGIKSCLSGPVGQVSTQVSGAVGNVSYLWNTGAMAPSISGLSAGTYSVIVTDANGCTARDTATVMQSPSSVNVAINISNAISCFGGADGELTASGVNGVQPYTFLWSNGVTSSTNGGLQANIYSVTITDALGCASQATVNLAGPSTALSAGTPTVQHVSCYGEQTGQISISPSGGTTPYNYQWSNGSSSSQVSQLSSGIYSVLITDANGCTVQTQASVSQPGSPLQAAISSITNNLCYGDLKGVAAMNATGGVAPYTYIWTGGFQSSAIGNLAAGTYSGTVTDANGCTSVVTAVITQPSAPIQISKTSHTNVSCYGQNTGVLEVQAQNGTAPYSYHWSNGVQSAINSSLAAGIYTVTVTDNNGCSAIKNDTITGPSLPVSIIIDQVQHVFCNQGTGSVRVNGAGGTGPFSYLWSTGSTGPEVHNLQPGWYTVTVTDAAGCTTQASAEVKSLGAQLSVTASQLQNTSCYGVPGGLINTMVSGAAGSINYLWSNGATTSAIQQILPGTYTVTVTDSLGCQGGASFTITGPVHPYYSTTEVLQNVICHGENQGQIKAKIYGGVSPFNYLWSNGATTSTVNGLTAGIYSVTVTDAYGCTTSSSDTITGPSNPVLASVTMTQAVSCNNGNDGAAVALASGGNGGYSYLWSNGSTASTLSGVPAGTYTVTVTDSLGCTYSESLSIPQPTSAVTITGQVQIANCLAGNGGSVTIELSGGTEPYTILWNNGATSQNLNGLLPGTYSVTVTDAGGCSQSQSFEVGDQSTFQMSASGPTTICSGEVITLSADSLSGGTYQWYFNGNVLNGAQQNFFTTPAEGSYYVTFTNDC
jgi:hypothetical protein